MFRAILDKRMEIRLSIGKLVFYDKNDSQVQERPEEGNSCALPLFLEICSSPVTGTAY